MSFSSNRRELGRTWKFADCEFNELKVELRRGGLVVDLELKPLELLQQLLIRAGDVVTKQELLDSVWPGTMVVDGSLATAVSKLRKALDDRDARIVLTVPRVGYRLGVEVAEEPAAIVPLAIPIKPELADEPVAQVLEPATPGRGRYRMIAAVLLALVAGLAFYLGGFWPSPAFKPVPGSVAVLTFQNSGSDRGLDYLTVALADEVATELSNVRALSVRPSMVTRRYTNSEVDLKQVGRELNVANIVTGHFLVEKDQLRITLEAINADDARLLWRKTLVAPMGDMLAMREQIVSQSHGQLATALGVSSSEYSGGTRPTNNEAYDLYLRSIALAYDPEPSREARRMLERSVELDPTFAPTWLMLSRRYYIESRYASGREGMIQLYEAGLEHARSLDPNYVAAGAGLAAFHAEQGQVVKAFLDAQELVRHRPDSADSHYSLSYALRFAGLLPKAATQCDIAYFLDPHTQTSGLRSCAVVFILTGDYKRAMDYINLDPKGTSWGKALTVHALLRAGRSAEAIRLGPSGIPQWPSFDMVLACAAHRPQPEIDSLAGKVVVADDPETNYFAASHLAYCGQPIAAEDLLKDAIQGGYCSYPAMDLDPFFANLRQRTEFADIRAAGFKCQTDFLSQSSAQQVISRFSGDGRDQPIAINASAGSKMVIGP
jgi:DNA-binding winged helix-turn-helix (wHTH) protein/TolB-like protein